MNVFDKPKGRRVTARRTICEVHRELYDRCVIGLQDDKTLLDELTPLLEEAFIMATKMNNKLVEYKYIHMKSCDVNVNQRELKQLRRKRIELTGV